MTISVRLDVDLKRALARMSEQSGVSKSEIIKQSLRGYLVDFNRPMTSYELGKDLFGREESGKGDLSERRKEYLSEMLRAKNAR